MTVSPMARRLRQSALVKCVNRWRQRTAQSLLATARLRKVFGKMRNRVAAAAFAGWATHVAEGHRQRWVVRRVVVRMQQRHIARAWGRWRQYGRIMLKLAANRALKAARCGHPHNMDCPPKRWP